LKQHKKELASGLISGYALTLFRSPDRILMAIIMYEPMITPIDAKSNMLNMFTIFGYLRMFVKYYLKLVVICS